MSKFIKPFPVAPLPKVRPSYAERPLLSKIIKDFANEEYNLGKSFLGMKFFSPEESITQMILSNIDLSPAQILANNQMSRDEFRTFNLVNKDAGTVVKFDDSVASKTTLGQEEIKGTQIIINPGLGGGDTPERLHSTAKEMKRLFPGKECAIYSPLDEGEGRFVRLARGTKYYVDQEDINYEESSNFFERVIKPRITDKAGNLMPAEDCSKFVLANFSIGCREAESHISYFKNYLRSEGCDEKVIKQYLDRIMMLHIGSPRNWKPEFSRPLTVSMISLTDAGSKKPEQFFLDTFLNEQINNQVKEKPFCMIARPRSDIEEDLPSGAKEMLAVLAPDVVTCGRVRDNGLFVPNRLGHDLANYVDGIIANKELADLAQLAVGFLDSSSSKEFKEQRQHEFRDAAAYRAQTLPPKKEAMRQLFGNWLSYQQNERDAERNAPFSSKIKSVWQAPSPVSACSDEVPSPEKTDVRGEAYLIKSDKSNSPTNRR